MTKETIIKSTLKYLVKRQIEEGSVGFAVDNDHDHDCCWDDVLAWIEAQPCEDCISREAVIRLVEQYPNIIGNRCSGLIADIKHLPSVKPKYTDEEIDKAQAVEQAYVDKMVELAVEETKRPKGKWIWDLRMGLHKCSNCGKFCDFDYLYCPNCGAEMGGADETN